MTKPPLPSYQFDPEKPRKFGILGLPTKSFRLTILKKPTFSQMAHAKYQLASRLPALIEPVELEDSFYFDINLAPDEMDQVKEWMEYCGWKVEVINLNQ